MQTHRTQSTKHFLEGENDCFETKMMRRLFGERKVVYVDNNATTAVAPMVLEAMLPYMTERYGNAQSLHRAGAAAARGLAEAYAALYALLGARDEDSVVLTAGATESNNTVMASVARAAETAARAPLLCVTSAVEHPSVLAPLTAAAQRLGGRLRVVRVAPAADGTVRAAAVARALDRGAAAGAVPALVSVMWANNETGVVNDVRAIAAAAHRHGALFHTDATQIPGKFLPCERFTHVSQSLNGEEHNSDRRERRHLPAGASASSSVALSSTTTSKLTETTTTTATRTSATTPSPYSLNLSDFADYASVSAHKLHGPKGVGALFVRRGAARRALVPLLRGGAQMGGLRAGTVNVAGAVGLGAAASLLLADRDAHTLRTLRAMRDRFEAALRADTGTECRIVGAGAPRVANTSLVAAAGVEGEALLYDLDRRGVCASTGSACASEALQPSPVLAALERETAVRGLAHTGVRISFSRLNNPRRDPVLVANALLAGIHRLREFSTVSPHGNIHRP